MMKCASKKCDLVYWIEHALLLDESPEPVAVFDWLLGFAAL